MNLVVVNWKFRMNKIRNFNLEDRWLIMSTRDWQQIVNSINILSQSNYLIASLAKDTDNGENKEDVWRPLKSSLGYS